MAKQMTRINTIQYIENIPKKFFRILYKIIHNNLLQNIYQKNQNMIKNMVNRLFSYHIFYKESAMIFCVIFIY